MAHTPTRRYRRRCMVEGCPERGVYKVSTDPPPDTRHPDSHYSQHHAAEGDTWSRARVSGYVRTGGA